MPTANQWAPHIFPTYGGPRTVQSIVSSKWRKLAFGGNLMPNVRGQAFNSDASRHSRLQFKEVLLGRALPNWQSILLPAMLWWKYEHPNAFCWQRNFPLAAHCHHNPGISCTWITPWITQVYHSSFSFKLAFVCGNHTIAKNPAPVKSHTYTCTYPQRERERDREREIITCAKK